MIDRQGDNASASFFTVAICVQEADFQMRERADDVRSSPKERKIYEWLSARNAAPATPGLCTLEMAAYRVTRSRTDGLVPSRPFLLSLTDQCESGGLVFLQLQEYTENQASIWIS